MVKLLLIDCGWIVSVDPAIGDLKDAKMAHDYIESAQTTGKVILKI